MRRGQAAMEFLSTYGWAIMVMLVAIGALSYFGVTNPKNLIPEKCLISSGFGCDDYQFLGGTSTDAFKLFVTNNLGKSITITQNTFSVMTGAETIPSSSCTYSAGSAAVTADTNDLSVGSGRTFEVFCTPLVGLITGEKEKVELNFTYIPIGGRYPHVVTGEMVVNVQ